MYTIGVQTKTRKICCFVSEEQHIRLMKAVARRNSSIGAVLLYGLRRALEDLKDPAVDLPLDGRKSAENVPA